MNKKTKKQSSEDFFISSCKKIFKFLELEHGFKIKDVKNDIYGTTLIYQNQFVLLKISYIPRDGGIFIYLFKLIEFKKSELISSKYEVGDIVLIKNPAFKMYNPPLDILLEDDSQIKKILLNYADAIKQGCIEVIGGDFSILNKVDQIQKERSNSKNK